MEMLDATKIAKDVANRFGEEGERPRQQLERIAGLLGPTWLTEIAERAEGMLKDTDPVVTRADGSPRTRGGVLFAVARRAAFELVRNGTLDRRDFHQSFCWREPTPRERVAPPAQRKSPSRSKPRPASSPERPALRNARLLQAEIYTVRRSKS